MSKKTRRYNQEPTRHHILPHSKGGNATTDNINWLERIKHKALHILFDNMTPIEQIEALTLGINVTALTEEFKQDVKQLLDNTDNRYYLKKGIFRPKY